MTADPLSGRPPMPELPREVLGPIQRVRVYAHAHTFLIDRPGDSDQLLDHPAVRAAVAADDYMPYWADLWPSARMLAKWIVRQAWPPGLRGLELGCGLGLAGIAALSRGVRMTFSDYDATALRFAADNARLNGFTDFDTLQLDWRNPPEGVQYPVILASDLIYEERNILPLVNLIQRMLAPEGVCLLTDQDRVPSHLLRETLTRQRMPFKTQVLRAGEPGGRRLKGTLYRVTQPGGRDPLIS